MTTFDTLLIANRGEIARRVIRSAKARGLRTVAVYSDADRQAAHVREADTACRIGPTPASESYLSIDAILAAARDSGAQAIHPGYGFLSERAEFARAVADAGLVFVGPSGDVMDQMGRKDRAREIAVAAGVPVVPDHPVDATLADDEFPILVKAAAGGGGKGMRVVRRAADLQEAIDSARREAQSSFGDDTLLIERYVENGRHVEVQVLADSHGHVVHLFERDCSAQRRHQKVIEEAPSPSVTEDVRAVLTQSAVSLARTVGYVNAGTVEFLVDPSRGTDGVYFLEMNTRLQVEHPVTELTVGLDLVDLQLAIAAGEPLPFGQEDLTCTGHAMEARVYAEDAYNGFLPQAGTAAFVHWSPLARNDEALASGQTVDTSYDPMLGKVIVHGPTREAARKKLVAALDDTAVIGLTTNTGFLRELAASDEFRDAAIDTGWLDRTPDAAAAEPEDADLAPAAAAWAVAAARADCAAGDPFALGDGWRVGGPAAPVAVDLEGPGGRVVLRVDRTAGTVEDGERRRVVHQIAADDDAHLQLEVDGGRHDFFVDRGAHAITIGHRGRAHVFRRPEQFLHDATAAATDGAVAAPMPGTILAVRGAEGAEVAAGETVVVLEAMKMEIALQAPFAGTVAELDAAEGQQVPLGRTLFRVVAGDATE
jgi:acetyl-CoA/propionyl-CoA carboxylase, biotin carboxylase, biotin carboxyl carrier protein